ncbi:ATP-binding protein [Antribacter sp. KLBMP9083]|uniref:ATP-binding protein n=1 Tax=Antribacter soli TaxID=2910976 RepID=A0AA41QAB2_9MICO|nr:ATP-binding protein [Antribacter soli]MCF4119603.1 ATP-binding protein [Antribacter soli]
MEGLIARHGLAWAGELLRTFPALVIEGARQVGKSTFAHMLVDGTPALEVTLDDDETLAAALADPRQFVEQAPDRTLVIDEVQRAPELILPVKAAIDRDRRPGRFVLTGSADLLRLERTPDSLAGRAHTVRLRSLSQGEISGRVERFVDSFVNQFIDGDGRAQDFNTTWDRERYAQALAAGGYPETLTVSDRARGSWIDSYLARIVQRDARDVREVDPVRLLSVLRLVAANQSGELVKNRVAQQAHIPATSITTYLDLLETLYLVETLPPWTPNLTHREVGRHKVSVTDSALAMRLGPISKTQLVRPTGGEHLGPLLEGLVISELRKQALWSDTEYDLFHFRDRDGLEVDAIVQMHDGRVLGIEITSNGAYKSDYFAGLSKLAARAGNRFAGGIVLGTSATGYQYSSNLWGLPISALWEL